MASELPEDLFTSSSIHIDFKDKVGYIQIRFNHRGSVILFDERTFIPIFWSVKWTNIRSFGNLQNVKSKM